jgi:hypothetical protein
MPSVLEALDNNELIIQPSGVAPLPIPEVPDAPETPETPTEEPATPPEEPKQPETPPEEEKVQNLPVETKEQPLKGKARENFAKLEQSKKEVEAENARIKAEWEATQAKIKEYEEKLANLPDTTQFQQKEQEYQKKLEELQGELKLVAVERDPEFIAQYDTPRAQLVNQIRALATNQGMSPQEVNATLSDQNKLMEFRDSLGTAEQYRFDAAYRSIEEINLKRNMALENRDQTYQQFQKTRQEQFQKQSEEFTKRNLELARKLASEPFEKIPALAEDPELRSRVEGMLEGLAGGKGSEKYTVEEMLRIAASSEVSKHLVEVQNKVIEGTKKELEDTKTQMAELQKKLQEREDFINQRYGSLPSNEVTGGSKPLPISDKATWENIQIQPR